MNRKGGLVVSSKLVSSSDSVSVNDLAVGFAMITDELSHGLDLIWGKRWKLP